MEIIIEGSGSKKYRGVLIEISGTSVDLGLNDEAECKELAATFLAAYQELIDGWD